ncbi:MAG: guanine deaminase, partial [Thermoanaerobaculia bacterium]
MKTYRAQLFTPVADPFVSPEAVSSSYRYHEDGSITFDDEGRISRAGPWDPTTTGEVVNLGRDTLMVPGFIDTHIHAPQLEMIGSYGGHLLEWLNRYTFPTEAKFRDPVHAATIARAFYDELLR